MKYLRYQSVITVPSNVLWQTVNRVTRKHVERKRHKLTAKNVRRETQSYQESMILQCCLISQLHLTWSQEVRGVQFRDMAKVRRAEIQPPLNTKTSRTGQETSEDRFFRGCGLMRWDQMNGPVVGSITDRVPLQLRPQQGGGVVLVWAGIIKHELVGPFRDENGLKINSQTYCQFLEDTFFKQWNRKRSASLKKTPIQKITLHHMHQSTALCGWPVKAWKMKN